MKKYESQRGAILLESTFIVSAIFLMLFGTVYVAIIGFDQMSADGASFEVAHQTSVSSSAAPNAVAHNTFSNIPQAQISAQIAPAPASSISVDYGYNSSDYNTAANSYNNRHGGVSIVQGAEITGTANKTSASILGMPISVVGSMVEPMWLENGIHFNSENANGYGSTTPTCASTPSPGPTATPNGQTPAPSKCFQGNIFSNGENTPPYFVGFDLMTHCLNNLPWGLYPNTSCTYDPHPFGGSLTEAYTPLGVAEYLDISNWCSSTSAGSCTNAPANPGIAGSAAGDSTFAAISCHQRLYATIANFLANNPTLLQIYNNESASGANSAYPAYWFYYLDANNNGTNSFTEWAGFDTPQATIDSHYSNPAATGWTSPVDSAIRQIYNFDGYDLNGPPHSTPIYPTLGC